MKGISNTEEKEENLFQKYSPMKKITDVIHLHRISDIYHFIYMLIIPERSIWIHQLIQNKHKKFIIIQQQDRHLCYRDFGTWSSDIKTKPIFQYTVIFPFTFPTLIINNSTKRSKSHSFPIASINFLFQSTSNYIPVAYPIYIPAYHLIYFRALFRARKWFPMKEELYRSNIQT